MSERMHPRDLRAFLAMQLIASGKCVTRPRFTDPIQEVDDLLAELARTEPKVDNFDHPAAAIARAEVAESAMDNLARKLTASEAHAQEGTEIIRRLEGMLSEAKAELAQRANQIGVACLKHDLTHSLACGRCLQEAEAKVEHLAQSIANAPQELAQARAEGEKSERERIIHILTAEDFPFALVEYSHDSDEPCGKYALTGSTLRAALAQRPEVKP